MVKLFADASDAYWLGPDMEETLAESFSVTLQLPPKKARLFLDRLLLPFFLDGLKVWELLTFQCLRDKTLKGCST